MLKRFKRELLVLFGREDKEGIEEVEKRISLLRKEVKGKGNLATPDDVCEMMMTNDELRRIMSNAKKNLLF